MNKTADDKIIHSLAQWAMVVKSTGSITIGDRDFLALCDYIKRQNDEISRLRRYFHAL